MYTYNYVCWVFGPPLPIYQYIKLHTMFARHYCPGNIVLFPSAISRSYSYLLWPKMIIKSCNYVLRLCFGYFPSYCQLQLLESIQLFVVHFYLWKTICILTIITLFWNVGRFGNIIGSINFMNT